MPNDGKHQHSAKWDECFQKVKAQGHGENSAAAICTASVDEGLRWMLKESADGTRQYFFIDPQTFVISEVSAGQVPFGAPVIDLQEVARLDEADSQGGYLVSGDSGDHLPTHKNGKPDHTLMGAAWAALHGGYRGNKYEGPNKSEAIAKLRALYKSEGMKTPDESAESDTTTPVESEPVAESAPVAETVTTSDVPTATMSGTQDANAAKKKKKKGEQEPDPNDKNEAAENKRGEESIRTSYFAEMVTLAEAVSDAPSKTIEVTLIRPGWSANGRYYSKEALGRAVPTFEGSRAFVNHPSLSEQKERPERDVRDLAGYYTNVRQADDGALKGTLNLIGARGEELAPLIHEAITKKPDLLGVSINALGKTKMGEAEGRKGILVEDIIKAPSTSTDIVTTPAAGGKFERLMNADDGFTKALLDNLEYDEWREARPDFLARMKNEMRTARKEELAESANTELATLREQVAQLESQRKGQEEAQTRAQQELTDKLRESEQRVISLIADSKLAQSKLPEAWAKELKPQLLKLTESEMDAAIETERKKYFGVKQPIVVREAGGAPLTSEHPLVNRVSEAQMVVSAALGVNPSEAVLEGESPEQYKRRMAQLKKIRGN